MGAGRHAVSRSNLHREGGLRLSSLPAVLQESGPASFQCALSPSPAGKWLVSNVTNTKFELAYTKAVSKLLNYFKGSNDKASGDLSGLTGLSVVRNHTVSNAVGQTACGRAVGGQHALLQSGAAACIPAIPPHHSFVLLNV